LSIAGVDTREASRRKIDYICTVGTKRPVPESQAIFTYSHYMYK